MNSSTAALAASDLTSAEVEEILATLAGVQPVADPLYFDILPWMNEHDAESRLTDEAEHELLTSYVGRG